VTRKNPASLPPTGAPTLIGDYAADVKTFGRFWAASAQALAPLPAKPARTAAQAEAAETLKAAARESRRVFLGVHADHLYDRLTGNRSRFVRIEHLLYDASAEVPGLTPTRAEVATEAGQNLRDKEGLEIDQALLASAILASPGPGRHLLHAMLLAKPESAAAGARFGADGRLDLGKALLERRGKAVILTVRNPRFLNAEDYTTCDPLEIAADVAILDPHSEVVVLRGGPVDHPKYQGRRVLGSGINLTHLYYGKIPYVMYLQRDFGLTHKIFRGVARPDQMPDDVHGTTFEKPWIAAVDGFAIGGACQLLLAVDFVIAGADAVMTLPARKEGIIPGAANLRLPRFTGDRIARQAIQYGRPLPCDSPEGRLICDEVVAPAEIDAAIDRVVEGLCSSGVVGMAANRRGLRMAQEPYDRFREYFAAYARDQAYCHFSGALIENLERHWDAQNRKF
jgi:thioesterase DpgC